MRNFYGKKNKLIDKTWQFVEKYHHFDDNCRKLNQNINAMDTSESKLQRKIIKDLIKKGFVPVKNMVVNKPGWPDITVHVPGKQEFFIEVKKEGKDLGPLQELRKDELKEIGKKVFKVDSWEAYEQIYKKQ